MKFTEIPKTIAAGSVVLEDAQCAAVSRKLAAAKCVRWRGRGELLHLPWDLPSLGSFLLIDLWSSFAGAAMLSVGVSVYCLAAETDPFVRAVAAENVDGYMSTPWKKCRLTRFATSCSGGKSKVLSLAVVARAKEIAS